MGESPPQSHLPPVMATSVPTVVWQASYYPFGGIDTILADLGEIDQNLRFPASDATPAVSGRVASRFSPQTASGGVISRQCTASRIRPAVKLPLSAEISSAVPP